MRKKDASDGKVHDEKLVGRSSESAMNDPTSSIANNDLIEMEPELHDKDCEENKEASDGKDCSYNAHGDVPDSNVEEKIKSNIANNSVTNKAVQVSSGDFVSNVCTFIKTEKDLVSMCNVKSFNILNELTALLDDLYPSERKRLINTRDSIIITLAKLKS